MGRVQYRQLLVTVTFLLQWSIYPQLTIGVRQLTTKGHTMYKLSSRKLLNDQYFHTRVEAETRARHLGLKRFSIKPVH